MKTRQNFSCFKATTPKTQPMKFKLKEEEEELKKGKKTTNWILPKVSHVPYTFLAYTQIQSKRNYNEFSDARAKWKQNSQIVIVKWICWRNNTNVAMYRL